MVKGLSHYIREAWKKPDKEAMHSRLIQWRAGQAIEKVEKPLRLDRARALGYKAKRGFIIVRVRLNRGGRKRERAGVKGRKTRKQTNRKTLKMNYKYIEVKGGGHIRPAYEKLPEIYNFFNKHTRKPAGKKKDAHLGRTNPHHACLSRAGLGFA